MRFTNKALILFVLIAPISANAQAQTSLVATPTTPAAVIVEAMPPVIAVLPTAPESNILRAGASVPLKFMEEMTTKGKKVRVGQRIQLEVAENVMLGSNVVIPVGAPAVGEITDVRNKGMWGKSGKMNARALYVRVSGRQIRLTGQIDDKGASGGVGAAVVSGLVFLPAGFFMTGKSAKISIGAPMVAFLDEDVAIAFAPPPPIIVQPSVVVPLAVVAPLPVAAPPPVASIPQR